MLIYEWNVIFITIYALLCNIIPFKQFKKYFFIFLSSTHLFIIQGLRSQFVGGDLPGYNLLYYGIDSIDKMMDFYFEPGYSILTMALSKIGISFQFFIVLISLFVFISLSFFIYRYSEYPYVSYLLYLYFGIYDFGFSGLRQIIAMSIILLSFDQLNKNKTLNFFILVIVAGTFHVTSLFFFIVYLILLNSKTKQIYKYSYPILLIIIILFGNQIVYDSTMWFRPELISSYATSFKDGFGMDEIVLIILFTLGVMLKYIRPIENSNDIYERLLTIVSIALIFQLLSPYSYYFTRLNLYYYQFVTVFATIVIQQLIDLSSTKHVLIKVISKGIILGVLFLLFFAFYHNYLDTNPHQIIPYEFFWD